MIPHGSLCGSGSEAFVIVRVQKIEQIAASSGKARGSEVGRGEVCRECAGRPQKGRLGVARCMKAGCMIGFRLNFPVKIDPAIFQSHSF